jgi:hypothetical protein
MVPSVTPSSFPSSFPSERPSELPSTSPTLSKVPLDDSNIKAAVDEWITTPGSADAKYGHISTWDTAAVTDMDRLFNGRNTFNDDISSWNGTSYY